MTDFFAIFWLGLVGFAAYWQAAWGWRAFRTGVATYYFHYHVTRDEKPFEFRMLLIGRLIGFLVAAGMFLLGIRFFWSLG